METFCRQPHCTGIGSVAPPVLNGAISRPQSSSSQLPRCSASVSRCPKNHFPLRRFRASTFYIAGTSSFLLFRPVRASRVARTTQPGMMGVIKAAFIIEWFSNVFKFLFQKPVKLFAEKLEADLDKAAKMIKTGATLVAKVAREADEFAEQVERVAEQTGEVAEKVAEATEKIEMQVDEILDVLEGEKKVVITSFKVVDKEDEVAIKSTTIAQDGNTSTVTIETSIVNDSNQDKTKTS